jgi:hypothetical protein
MPSISPNKREMAFLKWQRSGYRDIAAHDEFLRLYLAAQKLLLKGVRQ